MRTRGSELVRERAGTSAEDVSSGIKPSRTSSLPQIPVTPKDSGRSQVGMRSGGEEAGTSAEDVSSGIKPSRTSSLPQIPTASLLSLPQVETGLAHQ
ncbi:hypothetical protein CU666_09545 [Pseudomonas syringae pv. actinidifoliorum]|nr:hypothetical protein [Pseudomonas syringae pv. actinidifoliorum]